MCTNDFYYAIVFYKPSTREVCMKKSYIITGILGLAAGTLLSDVFGDALQGLFIVSVVMIVFGLTQKDQKIKAGSPTSPQMADNPPPPQNENIHYCKDCGKPLTYIDQYKRWYCYNCKKYA